MTMAPRGRPRRAARSDAAIDNMKLMGFKHDDICRELKTLLKTYGEDGWVFIESDSYKVLIEVLLEAQERGAQPENGQGNGNLPEVEPVDKTAVPEAADAGPSNLHLLPSSSTAMEAISQHSESEDIQAEGGGMGGFVIHDNPPLSPPSPPINNFSSQCAIAPPHRRRKPCYGWIDSDDDEETEIIELTPAIRSFQVTLNDSRSEMERERKRKTRWDVAPDKKK